jgi:hypothetical protein
MPLAPPRGFITSLVAPDGSGGNFLLSGSSPTSYEVHRFDADGVALWDTAAVVDQGGAVSFMQGLMGDGAGGVYVFWRDQSGIPTVQRLDANGHPAWSPVQPFGTDPLDYTIQRGMVVADGEGGVSLVQPKPVDTGLGPHTHVWVQRLDSSGVARWGATGIGILEGERDYKYVRAAGDGAGGVLLTWSGDAFYTSADIWALRVDDAGGVAAGWPANGVLVCAATGRQLYPDIAVTDRADA